MDYVTIASTGNATDFGDLSEIRQSMTALSSPTRGVGAGELTTQVIEDDGDDEIAQLGRYFNQMTKQLKQQRDTLVDSTEQIEERRRLFDSVLSSVTSGVIVLDPEGKVSFTNNSEIGRASCRERV